MTVLVHGEDAYNQAVKLSEALFSGDISKLTKEEIETLFNGVPSLEVTEDLPLIDALVNVGAAKSKREARDFITNGATLVNGIQNKDLETVLTKEKAIGNVYTVLRRGKKNYYIGKLK